MHGPMLVKVINFCFILIKPGTTKNFKQSICNLHTVLKEYFECCMEIE